MPDVSRTRATLRSAEFGFFGVSVKTRVHTPRRWGEPFSAGRLRLLGLGLPSFSDELLDRGHETPTRVEQTSRSRWARTIDRVSGKSTQADLSW